MPLLGCSIARQAGAQQVVQLKIGTVVSRASPWREALSLWAEAVKARSGGALELQLSYDAQQGDEAALVGALKAGQLDGAVVTTAAGLSKVYKPVVALQMPGLFNSWSKLDAARDALRGEFEKGAAGAGFRVLGWFDIGWAHIMSSGFAARSPADLKGRKPYVGRDDVIQPTLFQVIGGVTPVSLRTPDVLSSLNSGAINALIAPVLAAEQLQWISKLTNVVEDAAGPATGAIIFSSDRLNRIPPELSTIVAETGKIVANLLTKRLLAEDAAAFNRLQGKLTVVKLSADEQSEWSAVFTQARGRLAQRTLSPKLVARLEALAK
jgi:TRAP-type C4-dicarboxylate transport system substrate-binding protein